MSYYKELCDFLSRCISDIAKFVKTHYTEKEEQNDFITWYSYKLKKPLAISYNIGTSSGDAHFKTVIIKSIECTTYIGEDEIFLITEDDEPIDIFMVAYDNVCCLMDMLNEYA